MEYPPNYGIDTSEAGTSQERYFMVLAGLLHKNLLVQVEIRDALIVLSKNPETSRAGTGSAPSHPSREVDTHPDTRVQGKKGSR